MAQNGEEAEEFYSKIRWSLKQTYGFRDRECFKLKIYQLPEISSVKELKAVSRIVEEPKYAIECGTGDGT